MEDLSDEERQTLRDMINEDFQYILGLELAIEGAAQNEQDLKALYERGELWINRYNAVKAQAQLMAKDNPKLRWGVGPTEHCSDCATYDGRVYRASTWARYGISPQSRRLACKGYKCQCNFTETSDPCMPGRPPSPSGG